VSSPSRPVNILPKHDVLSALFASWDDIDRLMTTVGEEQWRNPSPLPGWTVHSLVAHMVGTESFLLGEPTPDDVDVSSFQHVRNEIGALNERWVARLSGETGDGLLQLFRTVTDRRRAALAAMADDEWAAVGFTPAGPDSYGRFMRIRVFDCWMHEQDIRQALDRPPSDEDLDGPAARMALDEIAASMGFVVGKLGKAPEGSRVAIELTGPLRRTVRVAVLGRAAVVDDFGGAEPTTTIRLDALQFSRLCGGRPLVPGRSTDIQVGGDAEVGQRIVDNLNYVI
jgi:uncharacterized protein (TIGR03083 family)